MEPSPEERNWIRESQQGGSEAFEQLIRRYQHMIHSLTYRMTGSMSDAEDLAQETFVRAFRSIGSFRGDANFSSWLYRIGVNLCLNWRKRQDHRRAIEQEWAQEKELEGKSGVSGLVQEALMQLDSKQRAAVVLTTYEGMNHAEAAKVLGCSETTVSWRIFMARKKLKKFLKPKIGRAEVRT